MEMMGAGARCPAGALKELFTDPLGFEALEVLGVRSSGTNTVCTENGERRTEEKNQLSTEIDG
jgi:hypothetical protein